jgi:hypothetical protein
MRREVTSAAARLDQFLSRNGVASDERLTVISDDAGEFAKTVEDSQLARGRILDWFRIAMKFQAAQRSVFGSKMIDSIANSADSFMERNMTMESRVNIRKSKVGSRKSRRRKRG